MNFKITCLFIVFFINTNTTKLFAQDYGCDKCSMLREDYENAVSPKKEEIYAFFKSQCLDTETEFLTDNGTVSDSVVAKKVRVTSKGKCIDYTEVKEIDNVTKKETSSFNITNKDTVYSMADQLPVFPGGEEALVGYIIKNQKYPAEAKKNKISGTVYVSFVISKTGSVVKPKVIRSPDESTSAEALRLVKAMPTWKPGEHDKKPVSVRYTLPVRFSLR